MTTRRLLARTAFSLPVVALLAIPATATAQEYGVRVEPGLAVPLTTPQTDRFELGGEASLKGYLELSRHVDLQAGVQFLVLGTKDGIVPESSGTAWSDSIGLRLKRPHDASPDGGAFSAMSPWIDTDALYVRTGGLDRFGLTVGAGLSFPIGARRNAWLGPFVRYMQVVQPERAGFDSGDARLLFAGLNFELGTSPLAALGVAGRPNPACPACIPASSMGPPDRDHDGFPDPSDYCPDVAGPNQGCPVYKRVVVRPDRLELSEMIFFAFDRADIEAESHPLLDEVVQALKDNKGFKVQVEGHTDSTGPKGHNQTLSEQRAESVLTYLRDHGIASDRLSSKGFGENEPTASNKTVDGRENNRRVDFVVQFKILDRSAQ